jgi:tripartite-type tricarboxylate transporter receptor subunit TctC
MNIPRRQFVRLAASAAAVSVSSRFAWADTYPTRPVRMIVPFAPGGPTDIVARLLTQKLGDHLGRTAYLRSQAHAGVSRPQPAPVTSCGEDLRGLSGSIN